MPANKYKYKFNGNVIISFLLSEATLGLKGL